jgi:hypothetical protein
MMRALDELVTFDAMRQHLGVDPLRLARTMPYRVTSDGVEAAWLSDLARASRMPASVLAARLRIAEAERD